MMAEGYWFCLQCSAKIPPELNNNKHKGTCPECKQNVDFVPFNPKDVDAETKYLIEQQRKEKEFIQKKWNKQEEQDNIVEIEQDLIDILKDPNLLIITTIEIQEAEGIAGEEDTIIVGIIVANTRLVKEAFAESKNLFFSDKTGVGKDRVTKAIMIVVVPECDNIHVTKMSKEAFTYWHANEDDWTWDGKVIHFEDIPQSILNCDTFKVMASGGTEAVVVKDQRTIEIPIEGKPVMIITSHHANPSDENLRRFPIGALDNTVEQTKRIKAKISQKYSRRTNVEPNTDLRQALHSLKPYDVVIHYSELIEHFFPEEIISRTQYAQFLDYICSSAVFHQYQREKTEDGRLIADADDYMIARLLLIYTTSNPKGIPTSREYREILDILRENVAPMTINEILLDERCDKSKDWLYKNLPKLLSTKLVVRNKRAEDAGAITKDVMTYQYAKGLNMEALPTWSELGEKIRRMIIDDDVELSEQDQDFLNWFNENDVYFAVDLENRFYLVLFGQIIPFIREELLVFEVLLAFFNKRNKDRYAKYGDGSKLDGSSLSLTSKIKPVGPKYDDEGYDASDLG